MLRGDDKSKQDLSASSGLRRVRHHLSDSEGGKYLDGTDRWRTRVVKYVTDTNSLGPQSLGEDDSL